MKVNYDAHAHPNTHEHEFEPEFGLPEPLPQNERVLWQGSPDFRALARSAFHVRQGVVYFGVILVARAATVLSQGGSVGDAAHAMLMLAPLALAALGVALGLAWMSARTTVYTITDKRVVMRIGIVLNLSFNLPHSRIANAGLRLNKDGSGDIPLALAGSDSIAFLHLWPHARPWRVAKPEPMLRCLPDAAEAAKVLAQAWSLETGRAVGTVTAGPSVDLPRPLGERAGVRGRATAARWLTSPRPHPLPAGEGASRGLAA